VYKLLKNNMKSRTTHSIHISLCIIFLFLENSFASCSSNISHEHALKYDEADLHVKSYVKNSLIRLEGISTNCDGCNLQYMNDGVDEIVSVIGTQFALKYAVYYSKNKTSPLILACSGTYHFGEHGVYQITIKSSNKTITCSNIEVLIKPISTYLPIIIMFSVILLMVILYNILMCLWRRRMISVGHDTSGYAPIGSFDHTLEDSQSASRYGAIPNNRIMNAPIPANGNEEKYRKYRLRSLDTFRGISIIVMIFVNYGGGKYYFFNHSKWNGLTVADLVFPWFIFIMGTSIFISTRNLRRKRITKRAITLKIVIRSIKLFALGLFINNGMDLSNWRIPGVLQRFAISYFVVGIVNLWFSPEEDVIDTHYNYDWRDSLRDLTWFPLQHLIMVLLLIGYLMVIFFAHDPQCPKGYFGAGGLSDQGSHSQCTGGINGYIDRKIFASHMYQHPTCTNLYECMSYDPEGLLGVIPSIVLTYLGLQAARILFLYSRQASHMKRWLIWAVIWGVAAVALCGGMKNGGAIPINKNLWSLSFIFATGSMAYLLLLFCYFVIDVKHWWSGAPFYFGGMNAILLYAGHEILGNYFPFNFNNNGQHSELLARSFVGTLIWTIIAYVSYKKDFIVKI